jgi:hypothetical protein
LSQLVEIHLAEPEHDFTPDEMLLWLRDETNLVTKGAELRLRDATDFVTQYATGRMTAEEAHRRFGSYTTRWGDAIPGVADSRGKTDNEILKEVDERHQRLLRRPSGRGGQESPLR